MIVGVLKCALRDKRQLRLKCCVSLDTQVKPVYLIWELICTLCRLQGLD